MSPLRPGAGARPGAWDPWLADPRDAGSGWLGGTSDRPVPAGRAYLFKINLPLRVRSNR